MKEDKSVLTLVYNETWALPLIKQGLHYLTSAKLRLAFDFFREPHQVYC